MKMIINIKALLMTDKEMIKTVSYNISGTGISLKIDHPVRRGDKLTANLYLPGCKGGFIRAYCEVVWCKRADTRADKHNYLVGIRYVKMTPKNEERFVLNFCEMMTNYCIP